jgi:hypothetical protein
MIDYILGFLVDIVLLQSWDDDEVVVDDDTEIDTWGLILNERLFYGKERL